MFLPEISNRMVSVNGKHKTQATIKTFEATIAILSNF